MPEGPEARRIVDKLRPRIKGKNLLCLNIQESIKNYSELQERYKLCESLFPTIILDLITVGKQLYFYLDNGLILNSGLAMTGIWVYDKPLNHTRLIMNFGEEYDRFLVSRFKLYFNDVRKMGNFYILTPEEASQKMSKSYRYDLMNVISPQLDIDKKVLAVLPSSFFEIPNEEIFCNLITYWGHKKPNQTISEWLLDQSNISGIGNYIKSEALYLARLNPHRPVSSLTIDDMKRLYNSTIWVMSESYKKGGLTFGDFLDPDLEKGMYNTFVYNRKGKLDNYGLEIQETKQRGSNERNTFWVPSIQI